MLIERTAVLALAFLCLVLIGGSLAQSQRPSPRGMEPSQKEQTIPGGSQQSPAPNQQAAPQLPPVINILPPQKTEAEAAEERRERHEKAELDRRLVELTGELTYFTAGLFGATIALFIATAGLAFFAYLQSRDMKASISVAKESADAAKLSVQSAIALQLPIIRIKPDSLGHGDSRDGEIVTEHCWVPFLTFFNFGHTKAFPVEVRCGWTLGEKLPEEPTFLVTETFLPNIIFEPDPKAEPRKFLKFDMPLRAGEWPLICGGKLPLWFYCIFGFDDFMSTRHDAMFCWRWQNIGLGMGWRVDDTPAYNRKT